MATQREFMRELVKQYGPNEELVWTKRRIGRR